MYVHFHNAPSHSSNTVKEYLKTSLSKQLHHLLYSPDVAPKDFCLLGTIKETFQGLLFKSEEEIIDLIENFFNEQLPIFWENIFNGRIEKLHKCIKAKS